MIPDAVLHRYTELLTEQPIDTRVLAALVALDAELLARWARLLGCELTPAALEDALAALDPGVVPGLGLAIAISVVPKAGDESLAMEDARRRLAHAVLAERLAEAIAGLEGQIVRLQSLLALAGVQLANDALNDELLLFSAEPTALLEGAHPLLKVQRVVYLHYHGDEANAADAAEVLLGLAPETLGPSYAAAVARADALLDAADLGAAYYGDWTSSLWYQLQIVAFAGSLARAQDIEALLASHRLVTRPLFGHEPLVLTLASDGRLISRNRRDVAMLSVTLDSVASRIATSARDAVRTELLDRPSTSVVDRQVLRRLRTRGAAVYPLTADGDTLGVCVFALGDDPEEFEVSRRAYVQALGDWLGNLDEDDPATDESQELDGLGAYAAQIEQRLREIVHEANNPLSIVRNYLHILDLKTGEDPETREQIQLITEEVRRATDVFRSSIQVPRELDIVATIESEEFDVVQLLRGVCGLQAASAQGIGVHIDAQLPGREIFLTADRDRLTQVLVNLVKNAVEAQPDGGLVVARLRDGVYRAGRPGIEIRVADKGPGLPEDVLRSLFEPKTSDKGGAHEGLGLHLTKRLMDELGGDIDVANDDGAEFSLFLPLGGGAAD
ncbi:MAG: HAMP domain-containing sensor histidine kinase [Pseudomonadota bacterium]